MDASEYKEIRQLFDDYLRMYSSRDDRLTTHFSEDFSGFTGGGDFLVKDKEEWVAITRQDFAEVKDPLRIELKDLSIQALADTIAVTTGFFIIHLPIPDHVLSRETARLVLIFRKEPAGWKISHSSISIPYYLVQEGEVYPLKQLVERNQLLERLIAERTIQLSEANDHLRKTNEELTRQIAERKLAGDALQQSNQTVEAIRTISPDGIGVLSLDGKIQMISDKLVEMHGYSPLEKDNYIGSSVLDFIDPSSHNTLIDNIGKVLKGEKSDQNITEYLAIRKDGSRFNIDVKSTILHDANGNPTSILYVERDITERKQAEAEREKLQAQLAQAKKMESVGRLAGGVAHDFNNMLSVILGNTELAIENMAPDDPLHNNLSEIFSAANHSTDITRQLLAFARKQTIAPKVLDLNRTIKSMLNMLQRLIGENIDLAWLAGANIWPIRMDPSQIDQILANLCINARDSIADVGKITIETGTATFDSAYCAEHPGFVTGDFVLLAVSDNGCGMDQETLANLFEPFFTTKDVGKGTGLGLATVYGIVKQNDGFINVYSEQAHGTTFRIYLPRYLAETESLETKTSDKINPDGTETILLVEDEPSILRMTRVMLERIGYKVLAAGTPGEAIALAREQAGEIHLLMSDVIMPEMNGRDLARNLLSLYPNLKRLFMSGYPANVIANHGVLDEGVQFIQKPFAKQDLAIKVREVLDEAK